MVAAFRAGSGGCLGFIQERTQFGRPVVVNVNLLADVAGDLCGQFQSKRLVDCCPADIADAVDFGSHWRAAENEAAVLQE